MNVVSLLKGAPRARDWSNQELAEFYRVEDSLIRAGLSVQTDRGVSDEGDPWFIFCHSETGDIIIHFARFDGFYAVASPALDRCARGADFRSLIEALIESHPLVIAKANGVTKISIHPAALIVALVMTCFFKLAQTQAFADQLAVGESHAKLAAAAADHDHDTAGNLGSIIEDERHSKMLLTAIAFAVAWADTGAADTTPFAGPAAADAIQPMDFTNSENSHAWLNALDDSGFANEHLGQSAEHPQAAVGAVSIDDLAAAPNGDFSHLLAMVQAPSVVAFDRDPFGNALNSPSFQERGGDNVVIQGADGRAVELVWLPVMANVAPAPHGSIGAVGTVSSASTPESLQEINNVIGNQLSTHQILDFSGDQSQLVLKLVEYENGASTQPDTAHSAVTKPAIAGVVDPASYAAFLNSGLLPAAAAVSETSVSSPTKLAAFDNALNSFTSAHPDFHVLELPNEVVLFDTQLNSGNLAHANVALWTFADGSQVALVGVAQHATPLVG